MQRNEFASEEELKSYLIALVIEYCSKMNEIEEDIYKKRKLVETEALFKEYKERYTPLIQTYATDKKRVHNYHRSYGKPTYYDGMENPLKISVTFINKNRAEIYFARAPTRWRDFDLSFVVLRKKDVWRIDGVKTHRGCLDKWSASIL
ncbi:MAG: RhsIA family immunity protein [Helicobacteraceae bacterium]|nr:RhsIA family immunity protein [Helicobacteraceae bacterium]